MNKIEILKKKYKEIKKLGYVECKRENNRDGGIGNTLEDLLGINENNKNDPDIFGFEIKSHREFNSSYITLFSKSPSFPKNANTYLRESFGDYRDEIYEKKKILYASVFGHRYSIVYEKYKMKLKVNRKSKKVELIVQSINNKLLTCVFWTFDDLIKASRKMKDLMLVIADIKDEGGKRKYNYKYAQFYIGFDFEKFLECIQNGKIMFDIRIGVYHSGKNAGKTHDHGSGFRIKRENFKEIYCSYIEV